VSWEEKHRVQFSGCNSRNRSDFNGAFRFRAETRPQIGWEFPLAPPAACGKHQSRRSVHEPHYQRSGSVFGDEHPAASSFQWRWVSSIPLDFFTFSFVYVTEHEQILWSEMTFGFKPKKNADLC